MKMPKVWEILKGFKAVCRIHGWRISEDADWVEVDGKYHNFLLARDVHPSSFRKILSNMKCVVRESVSYYVVDASYTAWLFSELLPETLVKIVSENPDFASRTALYDLSPLLEGKNTCFKLNLTDSSVFHEFEDFLKNELKVKVKSFSIPKSDMETILSPG